MLTALGTLVIWLLPGFLITGALFPSRDSPRLTERTSLSILLSLVGTVCSAIVLSEFGVLAAPGLWIGPVMLAGLAATPMLEKRADFGDIIIFEMVTAQSTTQRQPASDCGLRSGHCDG